MALVCGLSNEVPECPVISPVSGTVFERRLIEKYLNDHGNEDPINGKPLTVDQLVDIKTPPFVKAKPPTASSIPAILKSLQDEWDAVMLHSFTMRQQLQTTRQELSHALYQHDAACRVIARLTKEVTAAREALATLKPQQQPAGLGGIPQAPMNLNDATPATIEAIGISAEVHEKLKETAAVLTQERKRKSKSVPDDLCNAEAMAEFQVLASHTGLHSASTPGIMCLDLHGNIVVTGGNDKGVTVFNKESEQVIAVCKGHSKKVVAVVCHPSESVVLSGSSDSTVRVWNVASAQTTQIIRAHEGAITGLSLHATGDYILSSSMDQSWAFSDLRTGALLSKVAGDDNHPLTSAKFHPDGLIFATGTLNHQVKIWDLKEQSNVVDFSGHTGPVTAISFSENGYYLATAAEDSSVRLWDLRKLKNFKTIQMDEGFNIIDLAFDQSGTYLAFIGNDLRVYGCKTWTPVAVFNEHTAMGTGVRFGPSANFLVSTSMDRTLKLYGLR